MNEYNNILNNLEILKLEKMRSYLPNYLEEITSKKIPFQKAFLELTNKEIYQQALRDDITATREQVQYRVDYVLYDAQTDKELVRGNSIAYSSYDIMSNPYSTTIAEKKGEKDCAQIIANDIALRLGAYFHSRQTGIGDASAI